MRTPNPTRTANRWNYGVGDAGFNLLWVPVDAFFLLFYLQVARLPAWGIGYVLVTGRLLDLAAGVLVATLGMRGTPRAERHRPVLLWVIVPLLALFLALFTTPLLHATPWIAVAATACIYGLFSFTYTTANVSYSALLAVITTNEAERAAASAARFACAAAAVFTVQLSLLPMVHWRGSNAAAWLQGIAVFATVACACLLWTATRTRELAQVEASSWRLRDLRAACTDGTVLLTLAGTVLAMAAFNSRGASAALLLQARGFSAWTTGMLLAANSLAALVACIVVATLPKHLIPQRRLALLCATAGALISAAASPFAFAHAWQFALLQVAFGFCTGPMIAAVFARVAQRSTAATSAMLAFATILSLKLGGLLGSGVVSSLMKSATNLHTLFFVVPALFLAASALVLFQAD